LFNNMYAPQQMAAQRLLARGANWIYYIAALSLIYTIIDAVGGQIPGGFGLGTIYALHAAGTIATVAGVMLAAIFGVLGYFAHQRKPWAFIAVIVLYGIDGVVDLTVFNIIGTVFHAWALFSIVRGFLSIAQVNHWENVATQQPMGYGGAPPPATGAWPPPPGVPMMGQAPVAPPPPSGQWLGSEPAQPQWPNQQQPPQPQYPNQQQPAQPQWPDPQQPQQPQWPNQQQPQQPQWPNQQPTQPQQPPSQWPGQQPPGQ
jgi:hypothetical protein